MIEIYEAILSRSPGGDEIDRALRFLDSFRSGDAESADEALAWSRLVHVLFASTEFRLLD
mgnify:CR=1 FL=1